MLDRLLILAATVALFVALVTCAAGLVIFAQGGVLQGLGALAIIALAVILAVAGVREARRPLY